MNADTYEQAKDTILVDFPDGRTLAIVACTDAPEDSERWYLDVDWLWWAENEAGLTVLELFGGDRHDYGAYHDEDIMGIWWVDRGSGAPESWANRIWPRRVFPS